MRTIGTLRASRITEDSPGREHVLRSNPAVLPEAVIAELTAMLCKVAEEKFTSLPSGSLCPFYVVGTEVPVPGGKVAEGESPVPRN